MTTGKVQPLQAKLVENEAELDKKKDRRHCDSLYKAGLAKENDENNTGQRQMETHCGWRQKAGHLMMMVDMARHKTQSMQTLQNCHDAKFTDME